MRSVSMTLLALTLAGCASKTEQLYQKRDAAKALGDALLQQFDDGGASGAQKPAGTGSGAKGGEANGLLEAVGQFARAVDEVSLKEDCLKLGRGQDVMLLSDKARTFFQRDEVKKDCRRLAVLKDEIRALEVELGLPVTES